MRAVGSSSGEPLECDKTIEKEGDDETMGGEEEEFGTRKPMRKGNPREPTKEEKDDHEKLHIPFRSWVQALRKRQGQGGGMPERREDP